MMSNKGKILLGFIITFILGLNIYNIPLKAQSDKAVNFNQNQEIKKNIDLKKFNKEINEVLKSKISFQDYEKVIVTYWATWCPSCKRENEIFKKIQKKYAKNLLIIGISVDKDPEALANYLKDTPLNFPTFYNTKNIAMFFDDILAVPTHYIIDVKKENMRKTVGLIDKNEIKEIMGEKL